MDSQKRKCRRRKARGWTTALPQSCSSSSSVDDDIQRPSRPQRRPDVAWSWWKKIGWSTRMTSPRRMSLLMLWVLTGVMIGILSALLAPTIVVAVTTTTTASTTSSDHHNLWTLDLRPTSALVEERRRRRRLQQQQSTEASQQRQGGKNETTLSEEQHEDEASDEETILSPDDLPSHWFHPLSSAIYATLHNFDGEKYDGNSDSDLHRRHYDDFIAHRHLSRFERQWRTALHLDLHPNWHGNYSVDPTAWNVKWNQVMEESQKIIDEKGQRDTSAAVTAAANAKTLSIMNEHRQQKERQLLQSLVGGTFDRYQGVPLSQGFGTHYVHLWVGAPTPQRQSVIVDTGSHFTGFPVKGCRGCGESHHTDPHFDPSKSQTFRPLECPQECLESFSCDHYPYSSSTEGGNGGSTSSTTRGTQEQNRGQQHQPSPPPNGPLSEHFTSSMSSTGDLSHIPRCKFKQSYTEGSSWVAYQAKDTVYCGGGSDLLDAVDATDTAYAIPFVFGCLQENTGLFVTQLADGIMGMSAHELTLPKQLYNAGRLEYNMFAMCFRKELGTSKRGVTAGSMTLGGVSSSLDTSPMIYARNTVHYGWFTPYVQNIFVARNGGNKFLFDTPESTQHVVKLPMDDAKVNVGRGVIVDSGTTDTYINSSVQPAFVKIWKQVTGMEYTHGPIYLTQSQLKRLPTLLIQMQAVTNVEKASIMASLESSSSTSSVQNSGGGSPTPRSIRPVVGQVGYLDPERWNDLLLAIPASHYMEFSPTLKVYTSRLFFTETRGGVLGANAMQEHNVLFDWQHGRIGFAHSSCEYDLIAGQNDNHANFVASTSEAYHSDCVLETDRPILTQTCMESVDVSICEASDHPNNVDIAGLEIWTLMVETPGEVGSCERAMQDWMEAQDTVRQIDPSTTKCTLDGVCQEYRPCHVPCLDAIQYRKRKRQRKSLRPKAVTVPHKVESTSKAANVVIDVDSLDEDGSISVACKGWLWSACDHSCHQTRISSIHVIAHENGQYCVESGRERRICHVDACGRSDPCIVPFLVHAIFVLEGEAGANAWTRAFQDVFRRELASAAHASPDISSVSWRRPLFEEGDVNILVTRPWYGDDEEPSNDLDNNDKERDDAIDVEAENALGIQLILQISISNPKAHRSLRLEEQGKARRGRQLLQEVGVIWSNFTQVFRKPPLTSTCDPLELYPLAKDAHELTTKILTHPSFAALLVEDMEAFDRARLVSSWTIGTQLYDDSINFLGPLASTPFFLAVRFLHEAFILMTVTWFAMCLFKSFRLFRRFLGLRIWRKCSPYSLVSQDEKEEDSNVPTQLPNHSNGQTTTNDNSNGLARHGFLHQQSSHESREIEMPPAAYMRSNGIKRRNSTPCDT